MTGPAAGMQTSNRRCCKVRLAARGGRPQISGMRIHHINAISTCPAGGALMDGRTVGLRGRLACHCLLVEAGRALVLVDTGLGLRDCHTPRKRLSKFFLALVSPELREEMTAVRQIERLGFDPTDVR